MGKDWCIGVCVRDFMKCVLIVVHWALCATLGRHPVYDYCINMLQCCIQYILKAQSATHLKNKVSSNNFSVKYFP